MTEYDQPSAEFLARSAVWDYFSCGPEPNFGEIEVDALSEWIDHAEAGRHALTPDDLANLGWMYVERGWSRVAEAGTFGEVPDEAMAAAIHADLANANDLFAIARPKGDKKLQTHLDTTRAGIPMVKFLLTTPDTELQHHHMYRYFATIQIDNARLYSLFHTTRDPHDIPSLDASLGVRFLASTFLNTSHVPLVASLRHATSGAPADRWHVALYDRDNTTRHKVRIAPYGPPDMILLPPKLFGHETVDSKHIRGMLQAVVTSDLQDELYRKHIKRGTIFLPAPHVLAMRDRITEATERIEAHMHKELERVENPPRYEAPGDCLAWYETLSPYADPCHESHSGALEVAISQLEMLAAEGNDTPESNYQLGWMYMESGISLHARATTNRGMVIGAFERAEDVFRTTRQNLPATSARYFELAVAEAAAPMYRAIIAGEHINEHVDIYCGQLAVLAPQMIAAYDAMTDKTSLEAEALFTLLQQVTAYLTVSHTQDRSHIALPAAPRQRGGHGDVPRGWDLSMWTLESEDSYVLGQFYGRLDQDDPRSIDNGIITIPPRTLTVHDFRVLKSVTALVDPGTSGHKPNHKAIAKARKHLLKVVQSD